MTNLQNMIIKKRADRQHELRNKNDGKSHSTGRGYLVDVEYVKEKGNSSFCKGLEKLVIKNRIYDAMETRQGSVDVKHEIIMNMIYDFKDNLSLVAPNLANNHLSNLEALITREIKDGKWEPEKFLKVKKEDGN